MAVNSILPVYQRYSNANASFPVIGRKTLRIREKYVVGLVLVTFGIVCVGTFFFLPEFRAVSSIHSAYKHIRDAGPKLLLPPPPGEDVDGVSNQLVRHNDVENQDPHKLVDKANLDRKIQEDEERSVKEGAGQLESPDEKPRNLASNDVLDKPGLPANLKSDYKVISGSGGNLKVKDIARDHEGGPNVQGGEPSDQETLLRRNKIREVNYVQHNVICISFSSLSIISLVNITSRDALCTLCHMAKISIWMNGL